MLIHRSHWKFSCFLCVRQCLFPLQTEKCCVTTQRMALLDILGVCHVQVPKTVSVKLQIPKTPFQIRLFTVPSFVRKIVEIEQLPSRVAILVSNVLSLGMSINVRAWFWQSYTVILLQIVMLSPRTHFVKKTRVPVKKNESKIENTWAFM